MALEEVADSFWQKLYEDRVRRASSDQGKSAKAGLQFRR